MRIVSQLLLTLLLNATWQIALVAAVGAFCSWLLRSTAARYRHRLWVAALGLCFGLAALTGANLFPAGYFSRLVPTPAPPVITIVTSPPQASAVEIPAGQF